MFGLKRNNFQSYSDQALLIAYKENQSRAAFGEIYLRYGHLVMGTCMKYLKNTFDAEDMTMVIFEKLPGKLLKNEIQHFKSWLYMVTKNECLMLLRKKGTLTTEITKELESTNELSIKQEQEVRLDLLEEAITTLKEEQRKCVELFYLEKKSYQEIQSLLGMEIKKVKSAIQNGKRNLKLKLEGRNEFKSIS